MEPSFYLYQCDEFRLIQALAKRLGRKTRPHGPQRFTKVKEGFEANDLLDLTLKTSTLSPDVPPDVHVHTLPKYNNAGAAQQAVLNALFQGFQCNNREVMLGDGSLFDCTENICNQLQDDSNRAKLLGLTIRGGDVFGTWNGPPSEEFSADPSSSLGYRILDFFDAEWDSKNIHLVQSTGSVNQDVLLFMAFSSGFPPSEELLKFETGHPALVSFAKILLEIHTGKDHIYHNGTLVLEIVSNLELAMKVGPSTKKRYRSESPVPTSTANSETRPSGARDQRTSADTPLAHPSIQLDANGDSERELMPPQRKKRLAHSRRERALNHSSSSSAGLPERSKDCSSASFIHFYGEASRVSLQSEPREGSAHRMEWLASIRDKLLLSKTPHEDVETVRIAIIDTGIDTSHPYISSSYGPKGDDPVSVKFHDFLSKPLPFQSMKMDMARSLLELYSSSCRTLSSALLSGGRTLSRCRSVSAERPTIYKKRLTLPLTSIIILAAVGNLGNHQQLQYPANEDRVFKIFATDHLGYKVESCPPLIDTRYTFGALGHDIESIWPLQIEPPTVSARSTTKAPWTRLSGSSFSTPVAAAIVAIIFQFCYEYPTIMDVGEKLPCLKTIRAVRAILKSMSLNSEDHKYNYLKPDIGSDNHSLEADRLKEKYDNHGLAHYFALKIREAVNL
ncbi:hypothetical protein BDDG_08214 [Blastomyces dermatitidis ATCC 18188]|uniref:DUF7580 domain-containing protein n=1 Tax=Ajellomyces dermatitidis (strain ATCC 18188 / CBS 674.68) TaxID=653446 RepID=F2TPY8_AJEDA|nr:hypothetical protein BDDG_08214 [Blastomyces dermatitidis ATCC 18188]